MKKINKKLILGFILMMFVCFTTCDMQNPIIEKWWVEEENEYIGIIKPIPYIEYIYETITEYVPQPPTVTAQNINIINIEFIVFSGDQEQYNINAKAPAVTHTTGAERKSNEVNIIAMAEELRANQGETKTPGKSEYMIILHGHANPVYGTEAEKIELEKISKARAKDVEKRLADIYNYIENTGAPTAPVYTEGIAPLPPSLTTPPVPNYAHELDPDVEITGLIPDLAGRVFVKGYGGGRNLGSSSYPGLNRRVEMILFEITTEIISDKGGY
ncbi:MAG: hypothetical protein FWE72_03240 [Spirochaetaceae bacterium]|nr:hypothetical protein [Spirochaetaceae bacterium]